MHGAAFRHLQALEAGEYNELPGGVFRKGILRSYLSVLGLEETPWLERFEASLQASGEANSAVADWAQFAENVWRMRVSTRPQTGRRWLGVAGMVMLLVVFGWLIWSFVVHQRLEVVRPAADVGAFQGSPSSSSAGGAAPGR